MADENEVNREDYFPIMTTFNATPFLQREKFMYSFGDIKFSTPKSLTKLMYTAIGFFIWGLPWLVLVPFSINPWYLALVFGPPVLFGQFASKPIFDGRMFQDWIKIMAGYMNRSHVFLDFRASNKPEVSIWSYYGETWVSRRDDIKLLIAKINNEIELEDNLYNDYAIAA